MHARVTIAILAALTLALASALWIVVRPLAVTADIRFTIASPSEAADWSLRWTPPTRGDVARSELAAGQWNGLWLDLSAGATEEVLEIEPSGEARTPGRTFRLWLYEVAPLRGTAVDLKQAAVDAAPADRVGIWHPFPNGPGLVYDTNRPGLLRLRLPGGGVRLKMARTGDGGPVTLRYAGNTQVVDLFAQKDVPLDVTLERATSQRDVAVPLKQRLPNYAINDLTLRWDGAAEGVLRIGDPRVELRVFGGRVGLHRLGIEGATSTPGNDPKTGPTFSVPIRGEQGLIRLTGVPRVPIAGHAMGVGAMFGGLTLVGLVAAMVLRIASRPPPRWLTPEFVAFFVVLGVQIWVAAWAPVIFCPDSVDYMLGAVRFAESGSLDHFSAIRVPGYAVILAIPWLTGWDFNTGLGLLQQAMGLAAAGMTWDIARRFMPRGWAVAVFVLVGLSPLITAWQRIAMSESPSVFFVCAGVWLVLRRGWWDLTGEGRRLWSAVLYAAMIGVVCAGAAMVRGNLQLLIVILPLLAVVESFRRWGIRKAAVIGAVLGLAAVGCLAPRIIRHQREHGQAAVIIGGGWMRGLLSWRTGAMDENQTAAFDFETWQTISRRRAARMLGDYEFAESFVAKSKTIPFDPATHEMLRAHKQLDVMAAESFARWPDRRIEGAFAAFVNVIGLWPWIPVSGHTENEYWTRPLRDRLEPGQTNYWGALDSKAKTARLAEVVRRTSAPIPNSARGNHARILDASFMFEYHILRPLYGLLLLVGGLIALRQVDLRLLLIAALVGGNAIALAWLIQCGIDRYSLPFDTLQRLIAVYGLWRLTCWIRRVDPAPVAVPAGPGLRV